jgi:hypothetical protein
MRHIALACRHAAQLVAPLLLALLLVVPRAAHGQASSASPGLFGSDLTARQRAEIKAAALEAKAAFDAVEGRRTDPNAPFTESERNTLRQASARQLARMRDALTPTQRADFDTRLSASRQRHAAERRAHMATRAGSVEPPKPAAGQRQEVKAGPPPASRPNGDEESMSERTDDAAGAR